VVNRFLDSATVYLVDVDMSTGDVLRPLLEFVRIQLEIFGDPPEFFEACDRRHMQGCLLLSVRLPEMSGFEAYRRLKERGVELPTIFLGHGGDVPSAVQAMKLGAIDYFERPLAYQQLVERIQTVLRREHTRLRRQRAVDHLRERMGELTPREMEVLEQVVSGKLNKEIAHELHISQKTVEMHRARVMTKLGARTIADLVRKWCASRCDGMLGCEFLDDLATRDTLALERPLRVKRVTGTRVEPG
jgi:two-component system response regulator TtrR